MKAQPPDDEILLAGLGRELTAEEWAHALVRQPPLGADLSARPAESALRALQSGAAPWIPMDQQSSLAVSLGRVLRNGYRGRQLPPAQQAADSHRLPRSDYGPKQDATSRGGDVECGKDGLALLGCVGTGKSQTVRRILNMLPKTIPHPARNDLIGPWNQLVHLYVAIPSSSSLVDLWRIALDQMAKDLDLNLKEERDYKRLRGDSLYRLFCQTAHRHGLGLLVLDEFHNVSPSKTQGTERLQRRLVHFTETLEVPIVVIGAPPAADLIQSDGSLARRFARWKPIWNPLHWKEQAWQEFAQALWSLRQVGRDQSFDDNVGDALWRASGGVAHFAILMFAAAQEHAFTRKGARRMDLDWLAKSGENDVMIGHLVEDVLAQHAGQPGLYPDVRFIRRRARPS
jgi:hypothetical protein